MRALFLIFALPFWMFFIGAIAVGFATNYVVNDEREALAEMAIALEQPAPRPVDLSVFDKKADKGLAREVHIQGWINGDYNTRLIKKRNGVTTSKRFLMVLFGTDDTDESTQAKAALVMTEAERDWFVENLMDFVVDYGPMGPIFQFNGKARSSTVLSSLANDAMERDGVTRSPNFIFIDPYWDGREAGLTERPADISTIQNVGYGLVVFLALVGFLKWRRWVARKAKQNALKSDFEDSPIVSTADPKPVGQAVSASVSGPSQGFASDSPLARLHTETAVQSLQKEAVGSIKPDVKKQGWLQQQPLSTWVKGLIGLVVLGYIVPGNALGFVIPLCIIVGMFYGMKKLADALGRGVAGLFNAVRPNGSGGQVTRTTGLKRSDDIFARLH